LVRIDLPALWADADVGRFSERRVPTAWLV
jgi:hypothetical protein